MGVDFRFAARSDVGLVRKQNQDSGYAGHHLLAVADGMGGSAGGDIASSVVIGEMALLDRDLASSDELADRLREALIVSHNDLVERSESDFSLRGLGTTCVAIYRSGNKLATVHVGDSRIYLLRDSRLIQITKDHSLVQFLVDSGQITPEEAERHPKRSVILRVIGDTSASAEPDESIRESIVGDRWLLCSDGLHGVVSAETIQEVLETYSSPDECADKLIELALLAGAPDNVTCVIGDVVEEEDSEATQSLPQIVGSAAKNRLQPTRGSGGAAGKAAELLDHAGAHDFSENLENSEQNYDDELADLDDLADLADLADAADLVESVDLLESATLEDSLESAEQADLVESADSFGQGQMDSLDAFASTNDYQEMDSLASYDNTRDTDIPDDDYTDDEFAVTQAEIEDTTNESQKKGKKRFTEEDSQQFSEPHTSAYLFGPQEILAQEEQVKRSKREKQPPSTEVAHPLSAKKRWMRQRMRRILIIALIIFLVAAACLGWRWSHSRYYAQIVDGQVTIYQGVPQNLGPLSLSREYQSTGLQASDLAEADQTALESPVKGSLAEIQQYVDEVRARAGKS